MVVLGDDFTFCGVEKDSFWIRDLLKSWFDIKVRAILGSDGDDDEEVTILGRIVRWRDWGVEYEADPKHRNIVLEYFGFGGETKRLAYNGEKDDREEEWEKEHLQKEEATAFRGLAARLNFLAQDCPDLQFAIKQCSREMATPTRGSWKRNEDLTL